MRDSPRVLAILAILALGFAAWLPKPLAAEVADEAQRAFADAYVAAIKSHDPARVKALSHPAVLACINDGNRDYFDFAFADELSVGAKFGAAYEIESVKPVTGPAPLGGLPAEGFGYPVQPTHQVQIDGKTGDGHTMIVIVFVALAGGKLYAVDPCPNASGLQFFHDQLAEGETQRAHAKQLTSEIKDPLLSEIRQLLAGNRWIDAIDRYRDATGADLAAASIVIKVMQEQQN